MVNRIYPSDLTRKQMGLIEPFMPKSKSVGRPIEVDFHNIVNGIGFVE